MSKTTLLSLVIGLVVLGVLVYSTLQLSQFTCEVCISFKGATNCATASGVSRQEAQRTATDTACAPISGGMTESIQCSNTTPDRVTWVE